MSIIIDQDTGISFEEVEPGSAADPFSVHHNPSSRFATVSPAGQTLGGVQLMDVQPDGLKSQPNESVTTPASNQAPANAIPATPKPESTPESKETPESKPAEPAGLTKEDVERIIRSQQSSYDRRINSLQEELKEAREANLRAEREGKLEGLDEEEQEILRSKWGLEDEKRQLAEDVEVADEYFRSIYVAMLVQDYEQFGVTAEDLANLDEPEDMDAFVQSKELDYYRSGKHVTVQVPSRVVETPASQPGEIAPAGATSPTDLGGSGAPSAPPASLSKETGVDAMAHNLKMLPWESLPMPN